MTETPRFSFLDQDQEFIKFFSECLELLANMLISDKVLVPVIEQPSIASLLKSLHSFVQKYGCYQGAHQFHL